MQTRRFFSSYALSFNHKYTRHGAVFSERVKKIAAKTDWKILDWLCYIHHNPIHHHLCNNYSDWKYSSYGNYYREPDDFVDTLEMLNFIGGIKRFDDLHKEFRLNYKSS